VAEVVELGAADLRVEVASAARFGVRYSKQQVVQPLERTNVLGPRRTETVEPRTRFGVQLQRERDRAALSSLAFHL